MWIITKHLLRFGRNKHGVSNVIVIVLSLVILVIIASNVVLWSYQMNQLDWERTQENFTITNVANVNITYSSWFTAQSEYQINRGSHVSGNYIDTRTIDSDGETFQEENEPPTYRLDVNGSFLIDLSTYQSLTINTIEAQIRYTASDTLEKWFLKAYNWTSNEYSDIGFNSTLGHAPSSNWDYYSINFTNKWRNYVRSDGAIAIKFHDEQDDAVRTTVEIDFMGVRVVASGVSFGFKNNGSLTAHVVSLWIITPEVHNHYNANLFVNTGENSTYLLGGVQLPNNSYLVKAVTERGNTAAYSPS